MTDVKPSGNKWTVLRDRRTLIAGIALVYTALFMPVVLVLQPEATSGVDSAILLIGAFVYSWAFFFTLRALRGVFLVFTPLIFMASAVASYYMYHFQFDVSHHHLALMYEAEPRTTVAFIAWPMLVWAFGCTLCGLWLARCCVRIEIVDPRNARLLFITCVLMVCIFTLEAGTVAQRYFPYNLLFALKGLVLEKISLAQDNGSSSVHITRSGQVPVTVILIVGESARAHNWGLNGYARQTTPLLAKRRGLINFSQVISCLPLTRIAVPCILTDAVHTDANMGNHSLIRLFRQLDFFTVTIDMHGTSGSAFGGPVTKLFSQAHRQITFNTRFKGKAILDGQGVDSLRELLQENPQNVFAVFHAFGSHWPMDTRYSDAFRVYQPVCAPKNLRLLGLSQDMAECDPEALINTYDNSLLYTDFITNAVMDSVKGRAALVLYTSDHGQSLGEEGLFLHGHANATMERHVPMVVWATPEFERAYPAAMKHMRSKRDESMTHDVIFHSLLDCIGAKSDVIDVTQSLCGE